MVIDTSAVLAWLKNEPARERIVAALEWPFSNTEKGKAILHNSTSVTVRSTRSLPYLANRYCLLATTSARRTS